MGEFVADLEASLGDDFLQDAPIPEPQSVPPTPAAAVTQAPPQIQTPVAAASAQHWPVPAPNAPASAPVTNNAAAAAASSGVPSISHRPPTPVVPGTPRISPSTSASSAGTKASPFSVDAGVDLAEMFGELKQDLEAGSATTEEDPETHYNLGIAFREMGLLDEAIGELQKTCQAVDRGHPFPQAMQTYTWLAQCFLDKGVPEAAIRWYQKALNAPAIDEETRTALHYELASAYETAGDRTSALKHFMEVYGRNIDYRDVAERIKPLKS
jgi:tetratricopeptide (TPR) repeat protein